VSIEKTVLVTGGAGYVGSHVVRALAAARETVIVVDDLSTGHPLALPKGVEFVRCRVGCRPAMECLMKEWKVHVVVHLAARAYVGESILFPLEYYRTNLAEGLALLEAMHATGVNRMIFASSCTVYGPSDRQAVNESALIQPTNPYGHSKSVFEQMLRSAERAYDLRWVSLRFFNVAGAAIDGEVGEWHDPEPHLIPRVLRSMLSTEPGRRLQNCAEVATINGTDWPTPDGTCVRDYVHVEDIARAHLCALEYIQANGACRPFNLATGRGVSVRQILHTCSQRSGVELPIVEGVRRPGDVATIVGDPSNAWRELG